MIDWLLAHQTLNAPLTNQHYEIQILNWQPLSAMSASATIRYVNVNSASPTRTPTGPAATTIQDAVDGRTGTKSVTNGVYQTGERMAPERTISNRVTVTKAIVLRSVNGPAVTVIHGQNAAVTPTAPPCGYLTHGAAWHGGGVWCASPVIVSNCVLTANSAHYDGGGERRPEQRTTGNSKHAAGRKATLNNCTLPPAQQRTMAAGIQAR
jgi:hypothetical protein